MAMTDFTTAVQNRLLGEIMFLNDGILKNIAGTGNVRLSRVLNNAGQSRFR